MTLNSVTATQPNATDVQPPSPDGKTTPTMTEQVNQDEPQPSRPVLPTWRLCCSIWRLFNSKATSDKSRDFSWVHWRLWRVGSTKVLFLSGCRENLPRAKLVTSAHWCQPGAACGKDLPRSPLRVQLANESRTPLFCHDQRI